MKIAFNAIPVQPGGGLTVLLGLLDGLRRLRRETELIVYCSAVHTAQAIRALNADVDVVVAVPGASNGRCYLWQNYKLGRELSCRGVDVVITFNHFLHNIRCKQVVYHLNVRRFSKEFRDRGLMSLVRESVRDRAARVALKRADANVFESAFLRDLAEATIQGKANAGEVIYIGLPNDLVDESVSSDGLQMSAARITSITSPHPHKDNETMVRSIAELVARRPDADWQLDVAGGHDLKVWEPFQRLSAELGIADRIRWHGFCDRPKLEFLLRRSLCLLSTSAMESFAMVPLEGMARGCPPIVADISAMPESVGDAGILVPPHDPQAFAAAIVELYDDPALRLQFVAAGFRHIENFKWSCCGQRFNQLFNRICA
jgi:glycosyltransferase involved in cell wall biosynthesis